MFADWCCWGRCGLIAVLAGQENGLDTPSKPSNTMSAGGESWVEVRISVAPGSSNVLISHCSWRLHFDTHCLGLWRQLAGRPAALRGLWLMAEAPVTAAWAGQPRSYPRSQVVSMLLRSTMAAQ